MDATKRTFPPETLLRVAHAVDRLLVELDVDVRNPIQGEAAHKAIAYEALQALTDDDLAALLGLEWERGLDPNAPTRHRSGVITYHHRRRLVGPWHDPADSAPPTEEAP